MANELANAVTLMGDPKFREWVLAAACYRAAQIVADTNASVNSKKLASEVLVYPSGAHLERFVNILATRPAIASLGTTVGDGVGEIGQTVLITNITQIWASLADATYLNG